MRFFLSSVVAILSLPTLVLFSYAEQSQGSVNEPPTQESIHGVFVQTQRDQLLTTTNETYLLIDNNNVLRKLVHTPSGAVVESFRVCLKGTLKPNTESNRTQYPKVMVVSDICANS